MRPGSWPIGIRNLNNFCTRSSKNAFPSRKNRGPQIGKKIEKILKSKYECFVSVWVQICSVYAVRTCFRSFLMILDRNNFWRNFRKKPQNLIVIFHAFSLCIYCKYKKCSKIELWSIFFGKLEIYGLNSSGILLYALGTNYSCLN